MEQLNMFQMLLDDYKITKPVRLIELFAGYGSQALALKYLGVKFSHWRICEWAVKSIQAYKDIHFSEDNNDYSQLSTKEQIIDYLTKKGISSNYNEPMSLEQIKRLGEKQLRTIYNNIIATRNLVNISQVKAKDLDICDTENYDYIMTYSFPCQDLSLAGLLKGMKKGSSTRSGLLWEVERILEECHELGNMPQILLMENVPQVIGSKNIKDFKKWLAKLESLGYSNYCETINAKDYLIPQNRERTFMVSILGDYNYNFPQEFPLKLKLKDMLEDEVDEKYYLSNKMINYILDLNNTQKGTKLEGRADNDVLNPNVSHTLSVRGASGSQRCGVSNFICDNYDEEVKIFEIKSKCEKTNDNLLQTIGKIDKWHQRGIIYNSEGISPTICSTDYKTPKLVGQLEVKRVGGLFDKDGRTHQAGSIYDSEGLSPTLDTANGGYRQPCVVVKLGNYSPSGHSAATIVDSQGIAPTVMENHGTITAIVEKNLKYKKTLFSETEKKLFTEDGNIKRYIDSDIVDEFKEGQMATTTYPNGYGHGPRTHDESIALNTIDKPVVKQNLRIRKLTPKECFRLMGVKDEDYENVAKNQSNASLYHLAGDSIVTTCLMAIFSQLFDNLDWKGEW